MIRKTGISYYCNLASPFVIDDLGIKYIDYDLDIKVFPDGDKKLLDIDEYIKHGEKWDYPKEIDYILRESVKILVDWIENGKGPFSDGYVKLWYDRYCELNN